MFSNLFSKFKKKSPKEQETLTQPVSGGEIEEKPSGNYLKKGCIIILIILLLLFLLFLLALFYPVKKTKTDVNILKRLRERTTGESRFDIVSAKIVFPKGNELPNKAIFLVVEFKVENIAKKPRILDYSMVKATTGPKMDFAPSERYTDRFYESLREKSPWNTKILPYTPTKVYVVFIVPKGPTGFKLLARDFDWTTSKSITLDLGI